MKGKLRIPNLIPPLFIQIYLLFIISLCATGAIVYFTNMNNLKNNEGAILSQTTFLAQQSLIEFIGGNTAQLREIVQNNDYKIVRQIPESAVVLLESQDSFAKIKIFKLQSHYGFHLEYLEMTFVALKDYKNALSADSGLNIWILLDFFDTASHFCDYFGTGILIL